MQTDTIKNSLTLGSHILKRIKPVHRLHSKSTEQAAFVVLKSPSIPSVLVETSFIVARRNFSHRNALNYAPQQPSENPLLRTVQIKTPRIPEGKELAEKEAGEPILGDVE